MGIEALTSGLFGINARGSAQTKVAVAAAVVVACGVGGFFVGREVIGEHYIKPGAAPVSSAGPGAAPRAAGAAGQGAALLGQDPFVYLERKHAPGRQPGPTTGRSGAEGASRGAGKPRRYTVQVGVFLDEENSRLLQEELGNRGFSAKTKDVKQEGGTVHRVQMGSFASEEQARKAQEDLAQQGYRVLVVPEE